MKEVKIQECPYWLLTQAGIRTRHDFARLAERNYGLTGPQMQTLCLLDPSSPSAMNTLSGQLSCDASNVTGIADRLVAQGYLMRQDSPTDRRVKMLALTPKGVKVRKKIIDDLEKIAPESLSRLTLAEREQLQALLYKALRPTVRNTTPPTDGTSSLH